ncbi:GNAT family N-acetyltransferase [Ruegeria pomeroyi]|jgi:RimJ/RimL family protein N-acetyltransferase|uniref:Acetyltransferase, GNAT family n=2 Tax=Ruegeria pomeroyi TaxID=89184 RepID=Q5LNF6_RUEPO|nr:GNAT family N-acetyltransferase [Ruegeria pomeroyi]AAV96484.1 acetyltransferase, GNAT family [Ruegeria pomeroyi DSS-3]NVK95717.1 GNAT family N-acetyltransferase [Ruegeria pomeroyi]NVL03786.1 GNAT family N-acetyltransferase [Ruegeria pomeroyi]QWV10026.1 GNAT family N-acetyltransferase [Ruegeria pomeroyi]
MSIPTLHTERLTLRAPQLADFEHWAAFFASPRAVHERGMMDRAAAWRVWASDVAIWTLRGYGPFGVELRDTGTYVGEVGIYEPDGYPGPELGWFVIPEAEGKGYAAEAARAVMIWARRNFGWDQLTNIIDPANQRSIALGLRLGGVIDPDGIGEDPGDVVIAHDLRGLA